MTNRAGIDAEEKKMKKYTECQGKCFTCNKPVPWEESQWAHKIAKSKANYSKYGKGVIDHFENGEITCSDNFGRCNSACNIGNNPGKVLEVLERIAEERR